MSPRQGAAWALVALGVAAGAFALGSATAPDTAPSSAPMAEGPDRIAVPPLGRAATLPGLHQEAPARSTEAESEEGEPAGSEAPPVIEAPAPVEEAAPSPTPEATPAPSGPSEESEEVVPEGL